MDPTLVHLNGTVDHRSVCSKHLAQPLPSKSKYKSSATENAPFATLCTTGQSRGQPQMLQFAQSATPPNHPFIATGRGVAQHWKFFGGITGEKLERKVN